MKVDLMIIDYGIEGFFRYSIDICKYLREINPKIKITGCCMVPSEKYKIDGFDNIICAQDYKLNADEILSEFQPKVILVFAHRFSDYMFTLSAHKKGIKVCNFQHGLYQANTNVSRLSPRSVRLLLEKKREKIIIYTKCIYYISDKNIRTSAKILASLLKHESIYEVINSVCGNRSNADISFIFGDYWKEYYRKQYLEENTKFIKIGYPELEGGTERVNGKCFANESKPIICYIAQCSVEDATLSRSELETFLLRLETILEKYNLVIKFHPKNNHTLYRNLLNDLHKSEVMVWNKKEFPVADGYIGHESTLVGRAMSITGKVLIVRWKDDRISPLEEYTKYVCKTQDNILESVDKMMQSNYDKVSDDFESFIFKNKNGALKETAEVINLSFT